LLGVPKKILHKASFHENEHYYSSIYYCFALFFAPSYLESLYHVFPENDTIHTPDAIPPYFPQSCVHTTQVVWTSCIAESSSQQTTSSAIQEECTITSSTRSICEGCDGLYSTDIVRRGRAV
jgi:hypothetical protein